MTDKISSPSATDYESLAEKIERATNGHYITSSGPQMDQGDWTNVVAALRRCTRSEIVKPVPQEVEVFECVRLRAEGSDWKCGEEKLAEWVWRTLGQASRSATAKSYDPLSDWDAGADGLGGPTPAPVEPPHDKPPRPSALYVWLVPSEDVLEQPGSWRIRKWDTEPFPEANFALSSVAKPWMPTTERPNFDELALRDEIAKTWGEHGAHSEVYRMLLAALSATARPDIERLVYTCERNADEWRGLHIPLGEQHAGEAEQWQEMADQLRQLYVPKSISPTTKEK